MKARIVTVFALIALMMTALSIRTTSAAPLFAPPVNSPEITATPTTSPEDAALPQRPEGSQAADAQNIANTYKATTLNSGWNLTFCNNASVNPYSYVYASVTEIGSDGKPFVGAAHFQVGNVVPRTGYMWVYVYSDWGSPLPVWVNCHLAS